MCVCVKVCALVFVGESAWESTTVRAYVCACDVCALLCICVRVYAPAFLHAWAIL